MDRDARPRRAASDGVRVVLADRKLGRCDPSAFVAARLLPITQTGFVVTVLRLGGLEDTVTVSMTENGRDSTFVRHAFTATLAGRVGALGDTATHRITSDLAADERAQVQALLGARSAARAGGPVAYIPAA